MLFHVAIVLVSHVLVYCSAGTVDPIEPGVNNKKLVQWLRQVYNMEKHFLQGRSAPPQCRLGWSDYLVGVHTWQVDTYQATSNERRVSMTDGVHAVAHGKTHKAGALMA